MAGIRFITNTAWRDCAEVYSDATLLDGDMNNLIGGSLCIAAQWKNEAAGNYHFGYLNNEDYTMRADAFVWVGGASLLTIDEDYSIYKSTAAGVSKIDPNEAGTNWDSSLVIGSVDDDIVLTFTEITDADGYFVGAASTPALPKAEWASLIYFGKSVLWDFPKACSVDSVEEKAVIRGEVYEIDRIINLGFEGVTRADLEAFDAQHKIHEQPVAIYDDVGNRFPEKLIIGLIGQPTATPTFDDLFEVTLQIQGLKRYREVLR